MNCDLTSPSTCCTRARVPGTRGRHLRRRSSDERRREFLRRATSRRSCDPQARRDREGGAKLSGR